MNFYKSNKKGYTFVNVLTALFIVSILSLITFNLIHTARNNYVLNEKYFICSNIGESEINKLLSDNNISLTNETKTITIGITQYTIDKNFEVINNQIKIKVTVSFIYNSKQYKISIDTIDYKRSV